MTLSFSPIQRWLAAFLALWGIPAFLFWLGMGFYCKVSLQTDIDHKLLYLSGTLDTLAEQTNDYVKNQLKGMFEECSGLDKASPTFSKKAAEWASRFPSRALQIHWFDGDGNCWQASNPRKAYELGRFFQLVRRPWQEGESVGPDFFRETSDFVPDAPRVAANLRAREGELCSTNKSSGLRTPDRSYYRWQPGSGHQICGILVFVCLADLPGDFAFRGVLEEAETKNFQVGITIEGGAQRCPVGMDQRSFDELVKAYHQVPGRWFIFGNSLVEGRPLDHSAVLLALTPFPVGPWWSLALAFAGYAFLSLLLGLKLFRIIVQKEPWQLTLSRKLAFLFLWGVAIPLLAASALSLLYLQEKRADLLDANRKSAFQILDQIDQNFDGVLAKRERLYQRLARQYSLGRLSIAGVEAFLRKLVTQGALEDYHLISSQSRLLASEISLERAEYRTLLTLPLKERQEFFVNSMGKWDIPGFWMMQHFMGNGPRNKLAPVYLAEHERTRKIMSFLAKEAFAHARSQSGGSKLGPPEKEKFRLNSFLDEGSLSLLRLMLMQLGQLKGNDTLSAGYTYGNVLYDPDGEPSLYLSLDHSPFNLQKAYLDRILLPRKSNGHANFQTKALAAKRGGGDNTFVSQSRSNRGMDQYELGALWFQSAFCPDYPKTIARDFGRIHQRLISSKASSLVCCGLYKGEPVEIVVRRTKNLKNLELYHVTPVAVLERRLWFYAWQALLGILLACAFCLLLGNLLLQKFLVPVSALSAGMQALRKKRFEHRVPVFSLDEIGQLSQVLNQTIEHMKNMEMASSIQNNLYPQERFLAGRFEICGRNVMTQAIGGDYFDYIPLPEGRVAVILGDVAGHGIAAALVAAMAKGAFTILCPILYQRPVEIMEIINLQFLSQVKKQKMMSCFLGIFDPAAKTLMAVNAGQCSPVLIDQHGLGTFLEMNSTPLGLVKKAKYSACQVSLHNRQLVLYSDGLIEAVNPSEVPVGYERFAKWAGQLAQHLDQDPAEIILGNVKSHTDPVPWGDDATVVVIREKNPPENQGECN
ncbi:MAG: SpoIIE family protein phosphatase [Candidatus Ozemobacteraceae bacterium]